MEGKDISEALNAKVIYDIKELQEKLSNHLFSNAKMQIAK
jgi:hypothetical protein